MSREKEGFRDQLQNLMDKYPGREVIDIKEAAALLDVHQDTLKRDKTFPYIKMGKKRGNGPCRVALVQLARWMS